MTDWQLLFSTPVFEGQEWQFSEVTTGTEFKLEQVNPPKLGQISVAQALPGEPPVFIKIQGFPGRSEVSRLVLNPAPHSSRMIGVKWGYAEWEAEPLDWRVSLYVNASVDEDFRPASIVVDVSARLAGAEPLGASNRARDEAIQEAQALIDALAAADVGADPSGAALAAQDNAIAEAQRLVGLISLTSLGAEPVGSADVALAEAIRQTQLMIEAILPTFHHHWWGQGRRISGTEFFRGRTTSTRFSYFAYQNPASLGDEAAFEFILKAGNYKVEIVFQKQANAGIGEFYLNDLLLGSTDLYATSNTGVGINFDAVIVTSGSQSFRSKVTGKNPMSTGYFLPLVCVQFFPR